MKHIATTHFGSSVPSRQRGVSRAILLLAVLLAAVAARTLWRAWEGDVWKNAGVSELEAAARQHPGDARILRYLGLRLEQQGHDQEAFDVWTRAASADVDDEASWLGAARLSRQLYGNQGALDLLSYFLKRHPLDTPAHLALAEIYLDFHTYSRVWEEANLVLRQDSTVAEAFRLKGIAEAGMNRLPDAETSLRQAVALAPADWRSRFALAGVFAALYRSDEAESAYRAVIALAPKEPLPHLTLAQLLFKRAKTPTQMMEAQLQASQCMALAPDSPATYFLLGQIDSRLSHWSQARDHLLAAKQQDSHNPDIAYELARVYRHLGETENAQHELRRFQLLDAYHRKKQTLIERLARDNADNTARLTLARLAAANQDTFEAARQYRLLLAHRALTDSIALTEAEQATKLSPDASQRQTPSPTPLRLDTANHR